MTNPILSFEYSQIAIEDFEKNLAFSDVEICAVLIKSTNTLGLPFNHATEIVFMN